MTRLLTDQSISTTLWLVTSLAQVSLVILSPFNTDTLSVLTAVYTDRGYIKYWKSSKDYLHGQLEILMLSTWTLVLVESFFHVLLLLLCSKVQLIPFKMSFSQTWLFNWNYIWRYTPHDIWHIIWQYSDLTSDMVFDM